MRELAAVLQAWMEESDDFPAAYRVRDDHTDRITGVQFSTKIPPLRNVNMPPPSAGLQAQSGRRRRRWRVERVLPAEQQIVLQQPIVIHQRALRGRKRVPGPDIAIRPGRQLPTTGIRSRTSSVIPRKPDAGIPILERR